MAPFGVPARRSVLTSYLERDVMLAAAHSEYGNYLIMDTELILPEGSSCEPGAGIWAASPGGFYGPGLNMLYKLWTGSQGTLGIFTKMVVSVQHLSPAAEILFLYRLTALKKSRGCKTHSAKRNRLGVFWAEPVQSGSATE